MGYAEAQYTVDELLNYLDVNEASGIPPKPMTCSVSAAPEMGINCFFFPENTVVNEQTIVTVKGVIIVAKKDSVPENIKDGEIITNRVDDAFDHLANPLVLKVPEYGEWYVRFFPYSDHNVFNYSDEHIFYVTISAFLQIAAFRQDFTNLDPNSSITYLDENDGYTPMMTNASKGTVTYGDWMDRWEWLQKIKPYMLNNDGTVDYALDPNDYTRKADGTPSDISDPNYTGAGAFVWIPKLYIKNVYNADNTIRTVYFSEKKIDDGYKLNGFTDRDGNELEGVWIPMFYTSGQFKSIAGTRELDFVVNHYNGTTYLEGYPATSKGILAEDTLDALKTYMDKVFGQHRYAYFGGAIIDVLRDVLYLLYKSPNLINCNGSLITNIGNSNGSGYPYTEDNGRGFVGEITDGPGIFYGKNRALPTEHNKLFHSIVLCGVNRRQDSFAWNEGESSFPQDKFVRFADLYCVANMPFRSDNTNEEYGILRATRYLNVNEPPEPEDYLAGNVAEFFRSYKDNFFEKISSDTELRHIVPNKAIISSDPANVYPIVKNILETVIPDGSTTTGLCTETPKNLTALTGSSSDNISYGAFALTRCHGGYIGEIYDTVILDDSRFYNTGFIAHSLMLIPRPGYTPY